jgi:uncharacterized protein YcaQ
LQAAIDRLGFVQADPIRSPARAQDLILRHRVENYRAGDLERHYVALDVEEDYLYAYGFLSRHVWNLLHPRRLTALRSLEKKVLDKVISLGEAHPTALTTHLGARRMVNAWGGYSKATTNALEWLHWRGFLRVVRRENGIRVYQPALVSDAGKVSDEGRISNASRSSGVARSSDVVRTSDVARTSGAASPSERLRGLIRVLVNIFAPVPEKTLRTLIAGYRDLGNPRHVLTDLITSGELRQKTVDGVSYIWPESHRSGSADDVPRVVRFLAPFDPLVWDRRRFEHLWGWQYRFEAYTPPAKRVRGYYAMPLLWGDAMVGWANARVVDTKLRVDVGFVANRPRGREFTRALDDEIAGLGASLGR